jgi:hypothetical protein
MQKSILLWCLGGSLCYATSSGHAGELSVRSGRVEVAEDARSITLTNRHFAMTFEKRGGVLSSAKYHGRELLGVGKGYVQIATADKDRRNAALLESRLAHREPATAEVAVVNVNPRFPFDVESRYVLRADEPGFHNYIVLGHDAEKHPGIHHLGQLNFCLRVDPTTFTHAAVDDARLAAFPSPDSLKRSTVLMDATYRLPPGDVYSKYVKVAVRMAG